MADDSAIPTPAMTSESSQDMSWLSVDETPRFTRHTDGRIAVDRWPDQILIDDYFLAEADQRLVTVGEGRITFHAEPPASYAFVRHDQKHRVTYAVKVADA